MTHPNARSRLRRRRAGRRGFSLLELVLALALASLVLAGITSAMMVATRTIPSAQAKAERLREAQRVIDHLSTDVAYAIDAQHLGPDRLAFTVDDRDADASPDELMYIWQNNRLLMRRDNTDAVLLDGVASLSFEYDLRPAPVDIGGNPGVALVGVKVQFGFTYGTVHRTSIPVLAAPNIAASVVTTDPFANGPGGDPAPVAPPAGPGEGVATAGGGG